MRSFHFHSCKDRSGALQRALFILKNASRSLKVPDLLDGYADGATMERDYKYKLLLAAPERMKLKIFYIILIVNRSHVQSQTNNKLMY